MEKLICLRDERLASGSDRRYKGSHAKDKDTLFLSVADGDFAYADSIKDAVINEVSTRNLAYSYLENKNSKAIVSFYKKRYGLEIETSEILYGNGVLYWVQVAIHALSHPGDGVIITNPVYDSFPTIIKEASRKVINAPLVFKNKKFHIDWKALEKAMEEAKLFVLCSPHNPTGNIWKASDLEKMLRLARKHAVYIIADEIWQDITMQDDFVPILKYNEYANIVIHASSPAKTFNLGAMQFGIAIVKDKKLLAQLKRTAETVIRYSSSQPWVSTAIRAAYTENEAYEWFKEYLEQIKKNIKIVTGLFEKHKIEYSNPEATYLIFAKLGNEKIRGKDLDEELKKVGLHVGLGTNYGKEYDQWARINIAICDNSMKLLIDKLEKICSRGVK